MFSSQPALTDDRVAVPAEAPRHLIVLGGVLVGALLLVDEAGVLVRLAARTVVLQNTLRKAPSRVRYDEGASCTGVDRTEQLAWPQRLLRTALCT